MTTSISTILALPSAQSNSTSRRTYIDRFVENLSSEKVSGFERESWKWHIISIVAVVAIPIICIVASTLLGIVFPVLLPIGILGAGAGGCFAGFQFCLLQGWSKEAQANANKHKALQRHYAEINGKTPLQLQRILLNMGVVWTQIPGIQVQHPEHLSRLNPMIAYAKLLEEQTRLYTEKKNQLAAKAERQNDPRMKAIQQSKALSYEHTALHNKILNAFINAVLRNPGNCRDWRGLGAFSQNNFQNQVYGNALNNSAACQMFIFFNRNIAPITYTDAKTMSIVELGQRFITAMAS